MARKPRRSSDAVSPALRAFGNQVRHHRERLGLSQDRLGDRFPVSGSYIGLIETGKTRCTEDFAKKLDDHLTAYGALALLWEDLVQHAAYPTWFDWYLVERQAAMLQTFQLAVVYGLLQTPEYARVLLGDEAAVEARLARQAILTRSDPEPPMLVALLDESVLYRQIGDRKVMREQLEHLIAVSSRRISVQIVPMGVHDGLSGSFVLATMEDRSEVAYMDTALRGMTLGGKDGLKKISESLFDLRSKALSARDSQNLIQKTLEERWI
ncbi:Helix-turn-helix domain-containing protein [Thermomonospora echinospora]|uniref:Helix-turn-helix domain-containing protein n=1 Tax=Thermomonospora echinospora TaxID=1992 RepID=A0A1H6CC21_9ACTN|nr:helix-turn-helix transcriptional regulator [Thermomonospora echinospora]SEG70448.1 Helix-turn-helix domain-containing protein [Thermomonospora echinospora]